MMKNFKRLLSLVLTACFIISACTCTTIFAADETIAEKTLKYFDEESWNSVSVTAGNTYTYTIPNGVSSYTVNNGDKAKVEKVTGAFGKSAEDASLKLSASSYKQGRSIFADIFSCTNASSYPVNAANGDVFTIYVDLATDGIQTGYTSSANGFIGLRTRGAKTTAGTNQTTDIIWFVNDGDGTYSIYAHGDKKSVDYTPGTWVSVAVEITFGSSTASCKTYVNGVLLGSSATVSMTGLSHILAGYQQATDSNSKTSNLYIDNVAFYKDGFSEAQYKAIEDASALCVADVIGTNTGLDNIVTNLTLPATAENGSTITWASSNEAVISNEGEVTPSATEDTEVTLTATIANDNATETKAYTVTVPQNELISFDDIKGKNVYEGSIVSNLSLPDNLRNGTAIVWESSDTDIIDINGNVTRYNDKSNSVTLTAKKASDGTVVKAFELYVIGDDIVNDGMSDLTKMKESHNLRYIKDSNYPNIHGMQISDSANLGVEVYAIYDAAPEAQVQVDVVRYSNPRTIQLLYSADGEEYTQFTSFAKTTDSVDVEFAKAGGWKKDVWNTSAALPEGTRYLKVRSGSLNNAIISNIKIMSNTPEDITFDDIKGDNIAADKVMSNLSIPSGATIVSSSNDGIIGVDGTVTRPEKDTVVTLTMNIANDSVDATKIFTLTVLGTNEEIKSEKPWIFYNSGSGIALINKSTLANAGTIEFDADVTYYGTATDKKVTGIVAIYDPTGTELIEIKTVEKQLLSSPEAQRVETVLTLSKETSEYAGAKVRGFIWESGTITALGEDTIYTAK